MGKYKKNHIETINLKYQLVRGMLNSNYLIQITIF